MNFLSKDAPLQTSINIMEDVLSNIGCKTVFSKEKHPLLNCYSINLAATEAPEHIYSNGKGIISDACKASALGEYIERLQTNNFFIDFHLPNRNYFPDEIAFEFGGGYLNDELHIFYNPNNEVIAEDLVDFNSDYTDKIVALPFVKQSNQESVYFPINILSNLYVSNGLASGNSANEAKVQALSEIFERYAKIEIIKHGYALPCIPEDVLKSFERLNTDRKTLKNLGYIVEILDASLGGQFPVTAISLINPKNATLFVSFGAHPNLQVSLERTMSELMQGRDLESLDNFEIPTFDMSVVHDSLNLESHFIDSNGKLGFGFLNAKKNYAYTPWRYIGGSCEEEYSYLQNILIEKNKEMYLREYNYLGFYSCQMIVPSFSEIYPIDDMIYNNKNTGKLIRDMVLNFKHHDPQEILLHVESLGNEIDIEKYIGVIFENNFSMAQFKAQLYLLCKDDEMFLETLEGSEKRLERLLCEIIKMKNNQCILEDYQEALCNLFSKELVQKALDIFEGKTYFIDTTLHVYYHNILAMYDRLGYKKVS
jgi:ribosomal protein S12 methylthiotransferase accessory factor